MPVFGYFCQLSHTMLSRCTLILLLFPLLAMAQTDTLTWLPPPPSHYNFIEYNENAITNRSGLDSFYQKLVSIRHTHKGRVNIIHIGDSHLQADGLTSVVRNGLQDFFGNSGRGLVFPYQLANSNAPHDIQANSNTTWKSNRLTFPDKPIKTGISGYGIHSGAKNAALNIRLKETDGRQETFNTMVFFLCNDSVCYRITDSALPRPILMNTHSSADGSFTIATDTPLKGFELQKLEGQQPDYSFYGVSLEKKGASGVIYHTIGVNGARYDQFLTSDLLREQLRVLNGDLFIVSLGTNEAQNPFINEPALVVYVDALVQMIRRVAPHAEVLIATPCASYYRGKKPNKSIETVANVLRRHCDAGAIPCWNAFAICGGLAAAPAWKKYGLLSHDLVHYNNAGYSLQGSLLLHALARGYNLYEARHPWKPAKPAIKPAPAPKPLKIQNEIAKLKLEVPVTSSINTAKNDSLKAQPITRPETTGKKNNIIVTYED